MALPAILAATAALPVMGMGAQMNAQPQQKQSTASGIPGQEEWQKLVTAARKEGKVMLYGDSPAVKGKLAETFLKKYGVEIEIMIARPAETAEKLQRERRAGI